MDDKELAREGKGSEASGGIIFDIAVDPDLIRGSYSMRWYVWFFVCVCMYVFIDVANRWFSILTYTI